MYWLSKMVMGYYNTSFLIVKRFLIVAENRVNPSLDKPFFSSHKNVPSLFEIPTDETRVTHSLRIQEAIPKFVISLKRWHGRTILYLLNKSRDFY